MAHGSSTLLEFRLLPNPCSTMKAGRRSRAPAGTRTTPASASPFDLNATRSSAIAYSPLRVSSIDSAIAPSCCLSMCQIV